MKNLTVMVVTGMLLCGSSFPSLAEVQDDRSESVRLGDAALAYAAGSIQKITPGIGQVNVVTGDNQASGARMILGMGDTVYLKLDHSQDVQVGDLLTVYRRMRKVFHPATKEYLGYITVRLAVVRITQVDDLTTVTVVRSYGAFNPGDLVDRFVPPPTTKNSQPVGNRADLSGMIVDIQADPSMTLVAQRNIVYLDRGQEHGLVAGDLLDIYRKASGIPSRKIGQMRILSTEAKTATAQITHTTTRVMTGDRYKLAGQTGPAAQSLDIPPSPLTTTNVKPAVQTPAPAVIPSDLVAKTLTVQDAAGQSRLNLGDLTNPLRYDSGEAAIRPDGYKVLDQLIEYLQSSGDTRLIHIEGHSDNMEIGPTLKSRYPNNWELSKARANGVARYLVEKGGVDSARVSALAYGDSRPAATNSSEQGRLSNRRVEIMLVAPQHTSEPKTAQSEPAATELATGTASAAVQSQSQNTTATLAETTPSTGGPVLESPAPDANPVSGEGAGTLSVPNTSSQTQPETAGQPNTPAL